jgi:catechol 2,3-dioxygenase-like lactoylglutathione lyase family enzyme
MIKVTRIGHATFETPDVERQIAYFTDIVGLVLAERDGDRAFLATRLGDLVVQLEKGAASRCARISFQVAPDTDFADLRRGLEAEGVRCDLRPDPSPGIERALTFADPKGTLIEVFSAARPF